MKIIFVCTGNTCRSPMAEGIFKTLIKPEDNLEVCSRGIAACVGEKVSENSTKALLKMGIDISNHTACMLTDDDIQTADYVFTMTTSQALMIRDALPQYSDKVFSIKEFTCFDDVADPFGGDLSCYTECSIQINKSLLKIYQRLTDEENEYIV